MMDFIEGLPNSLGKNVVMVVVDILSKYTHFTPLAHPYTNGTVAKYFMDHIFKLHGLPKILPVAETQCLLAISRRSCSVSNRIEFLMSLTYHPQTDGQIEMNKGLERVHKVFNWKIDPKIGCGVYL
jgi:hypothetical protein